MVGNCCIKKFLPNKTKTCEMCNAPHKRTKTNTCKDCEKAGKSVMKFGKYKGKPYCEIFKLNKDYLLWVAENVKPMNAELRSFLDRCVPKLKQKVSLTTTPSHNSF